MIEHLALSGGNKRWTPAQMLRHVAAEIEAGNVACDKAVLILHDGSDAMSPEYWACNIERLEIAGLGAWLAKRAWEANEGEE